MRLEAQTDSSTFVGSALRSPKLSVLLVLTAVFVFITWVQAWICDDAYISLRTIDNFYNGFGLRWNVDERVQVYTHPLWLLLLCTVYLGASSHFAVVIGLSIFASAGTFFLILSRSIKRNGYLGLGIASLLLLSPSFIHYSTSGLENPLSHLLCFLFFALFADGQTSVVFVGKKISPTLRFFLFGLLACLILLTRLDLGLLIAPAFASVAIAYPGLSHKKKAIILSLGFLPLFVWELFSAFYYGSLVPNTALAKLNTGIPAMERVHQGFLYLAGSLRFDPVAAIIVTAGIAMGLSSPSEKTGVSSRLWVLGIVSYLVYLVWVGGDFMQGRLLSPVLLISILLLVRYPYTRVVPAKVLSLGLLSVLLLGLLHPKNPVLSWSASKRVDKGTFGVVDERSYYLKGSSLLGLERWQIPPRSSFAWDGMRLRAKTVFESGPVTTTHHFVGMYGFWAGPKVHIIDGHALTDPFLSRFPVAYDPAWRAGHYRRVIPGDYFHSVEKHRALLRNPRNNELLRDIRFVVGGPLWNSSRITNSFRLAFAGPKVTPDTFSFRYPDLVHMTEHEASDFARREPITVQRSGLKVYLKNKSRASLLRFRVSPDAWLELRLSKRGKQVYTTTLLPTVGNPWRYEGKKKPPKTESRYARVPKDVRSGGFDRIWILPADAPSDFQFAGFGMR